MLLNRIKDILKDSSIYGVSKILGQLISFFLIPIYTSYLTPDDYGVLSMIGIAATSLSLLMTFGLDSATYRYVGMSESEEDQKAYVANAQILTTFVILVLTVLSIVFLDKLNSFIVSSDSPILFLVIGIVIAVGSTISSIPRAYLRIRRKVRIIAISSLLNIITSISLTILFVVILKLGVLGALLGNLGGALVNSIYMLFYVTGINYYNYSLVKSKDLLLYSLPTLPTQVFAFAMPIYSQWSVKELMSLEQLGLYAVGLKFTLPISVSQGMFQQAYAPYKYEILKTDTNPKETFRKLMNLYTLTIGSLVLLVSFFGGNVLKLMTTESYHLAYSYVFYIALIPLSQGLYFMLGTGLEFARSPIYRPFVSAAGLLTVVLTNTYFINTLGVPGAALSITLGWLVMALGTFVYAQTLYAVKYNWSLILGYLGFVISISYLLNDEQPYFFLIKITVSILVLAVFLYLAIYKYNILKIIKKKI